MPLPIRAGRRTIEVSRPDKLLIPPDITKADLARYYADVAPVMLAHLKGRPVNYERYPDGIDGHRIFQQHAAGHFPDWIRRAEVAKRGGTVEHVVASEPATFVYLANQACVTFHAWPSRVDRLSRPDRMIFDLDPAEQTPEEVRRAALEMAALLAELGLEPWPMTSGSRGYHLVIPLQRRAEFESVRTFAHDLATLACRRHPHLFTTEQRKAARGGRILVDYMRNGYGHTSVAPYSVRARPGAPVATPLTPEELEDPATEPQRWTLRTIAHRLERDGEPWRGIERSRQTLSSARRRLDAALRE